MREQPAQGGDGRMDAYERLLGDAMVGDATLFARQDVVEAAWAIVDPVIHGSGPAVRVRARHLGPARGRPARRRRRRLEHAPVSDDRHALYLVRHGATQLTAEDRFAGRVGVDLSDEGRRQVERLAARLGDDGIGASTPAR